MSTDLDQKGPVAQSAPVQTQRPNLIGRWSGCWQLSARIVVRSRPCDAPGPLLSAKRVDDKPKPTQTDLTCLLLCTSCCCVQVAVGPLLLLGAVGR